MKDLSTLGFDFMLFVNAVYFCLGTIGAAGVTELLFFSLGLEDPYFGPDDKPIAKKGRIFSFFGKYWPLKCAYCFNVWLSFGCFGMLFVGLGWHEYALITVPVFAGISHIVLKFAKSLY